MAGKKGLHKMKKSNIAVNDVVQDNVISILPKETFLKNHVVLCMSFNTVGGEHSMRCYTDGIWYNLTPETAGINLKNRGYKMSDLADFFRYAQDVSEKLKELGYTIEVFTEVNGVQYDVLNSFKHMRIV